MSRPLPTYNPSTSSLTPSSAQALADPETKQVDAAVLDYFIIELTNTLKHSSAVATARFKRREAELIEAGLLAPPPPRKEPPSGVRDSVNSATSLASNRNVKPLDDAEEAVRQRLENIGVIVGGNLAERLSRARSIRFVDPLDTVKFLCKDVWTAIWDKPVDNLRTNHRGVYVLQDNSFKPLLRISSPLGSTEALRQARLYLAYPAGMIKGALQRLGLPGVVVPETTTLPQCTFQVKLPKSVP